MHRFYAHVKTAPGAACSLRCCGNSFANRILRNGAGHRDSRVLPKMRRYVRHAEAQAVRREIEAGIYEAYLDTEFEQMVRKLERFVEQMRQEGFYFNLVTGQLER